ncbi:MAG: hypothetical protein KDC07_06890 [Chitinophagaceae bacterium]|nr:hypothetical protein [Chitinophagaceae bacterium]MCB9047021.1 hypothetical protein [Chitinophagales bacterium]
MRITYNILGCVFATVILLGCVRKNDVLDPITTPPGGKTDSLGATLKVTPQHHKVTINAGMVYIKYAAKTMPASMDMYDDSMTVASSAAMFDSLTQGDYYIYAIGHDYSLQQGSDVVYGGAYFHIIDSAEITYDLYLQLDNPNHHDYRR